LLSPSSCVSQKQEKFANLPVRMYLDPSVSIDTYETQWRKLYFVNWQEKFEEKEIPNCSTKFWSTVWKYKDGNSCQFFEQLAEAALKSFCIPTSNAVVERTFSTMNIAKSKIRNKTGMQLLEAILRLRIYFNVKNMSCKNFTSNATMLWLHRPCTTHKKK
jgi:hypothetical protein